MFYGVKALLISVPGTSLKRHATVIAAFREPWAQTNKIEPEYHRWIVSAFEARGKADYMIGEAYEKEDADLHITHAEVMIRRVRELLET